MPLLIVLHGGGGTGEKMEKLTRGGFNTLADREDFIVVYPDGVEKHWNDGREVQSWRSHRENIDDVGFISALIDHLSEELNIDKKRVYAVGISNGGMMSQRLACDLTEKITAIGVVASSMSENLSMVCKPTTPISVLIISGTEDPLVPFEGGDIGFGRLKLGRVLSVDETVRFWVDHNKCSSPPEIMWEPDRDPQDGTRVRKEVYGQCSDGTDVILYVIEGGGHTWPSGYQYLPESIIGKTSKDIDANETIWNFFKGHSMNEISFIEPAEKPSFQSAVMRLTILSEPGGRVSFLHTKNLIAFDKVGKDGYLDVYVIHPDGSGLQCLTCDKAALPQLQNGNPQWHPSGEYIVFQSQDPNLSGLPLGPLGNYLASPGIGLNNDLWVMTADGSNFWQLTYVKERHGTLHPHFSPDGKKLLWSEIISLQMDRIGHWAIKLADFVIEDGEPHLSNIQTLQPNDLQLYEVHGFSPDGTKILFSGVEEGKYYYDMEIYMMDLSTGKTTQLTYNDEWDEHVHFTSDGRSIIWVSSEGIKQPKGNSWEDIFQNPPILEYWMMNLDGSGKRRLSGFNDSNAPEYMDIEDGVGLGDFDIGPDGKTIVAKMRRGRGLELTVLIEFDFKAHLADAKNKNHQNYVLKDMGCNFCLTKTPTVKIKG